MIMALIADEYTWVAGTVSGEPTIESPRDGHHLVVRFELTVDQTGGTTVAQPVEARGATAKYLQDRGIAKGNYVMAAGLIRTDGAAGTAPYLLLRIVSTDTSETVGE
jgi:hypothetical protein